MIEDDELNKIKMKTESLKGHKIDKKGAKNMTRMQQIMNFLDSTQMFFLLISSPFIILTPFIIKNVLEIVEDTHKNRPDYEGPKWADFLLLFITLPAIAIGKYLTYRSFVGFYDRNLPQKYQGKIRQVKIEKACENIFKAGYFIAISLYGYFAVIRLLPFDSPVIGNGSWHNYFIDYPYAPFIEATKYYCLLNLSYHTESAIQMIIRPGNDFFEMFCHHTMTFLIISGAYICNYNNIAVLFMLIIDNADIFVGLVRAGIDVLPEKLSFSIYIVLMISWAYTRLYVFVFEMLWIACFSTFKYFSGRLTPHIFMSCMLSVLAILNYYWFFLL